MIDEVTLKFFSTTASTIPTANGTLRLADNSSLSHSVSGRLEVSYNGIWMSVCGLFFSQYAADTACKQLGYTTASAYCKNAWYVVKYTYVVTIRKSVFCLRK